MPIKRLIDPRRMRKALPRGFGWIDHRLLREGYISRCSPQAVPSHVIRGSFLTLITTEVWSGIGDSTGFKYLLVKGWEFFRVPCANGRKPPWPPDGGSGVEQAKVVADR